MTIFWLDGGGAIINASSDDAPAPPGSVNGIYDGVNSPPADTVAGPAPENGTQTWTGSAWTASPLTELKAIKTTGFTAEGVTRIAAQVSDWDSLDTIKTVAGLWASHLAANATLPQTTAKDIYLYLRDTVPAKLAAVTTQGELDAIDPSAADPFGDGTPWPT